MKKFYKTVLIPALFIVLILYSKSGYAQLCPDGTPSGGVAFDTTVAFSIGVTSKQIKFPKFDPQTAMLSCVKLVVTLVGVVNYVGLQNTSASSNQADFYYNRSDNMAGPGLTPALSNSFNGQYGPYNLTPYDGIAGAGSDFQSISNDTVLKKVMTRTLTDSLTISEFYGTDSLVYNYNMSLFSYAAFTADNNSSISTSTLVNFRLEYCTCPIASLPLGLKNFTVAKRSALSALLQWEAEAGTDNYLYEIEVSRDGSSFSKAGTVGKLFNIVKPAYQYGFATKPNEYGRYYFRVKQRWMDGYFKYSEIRAVDFANPLFSTISLYPNPSLGTIGIKFVSAKAGKFLVQVSNAVGQVIITKELLVAETDYKSVATLTAGMYYVKITDIATQASCINQMVVK